MLGSDHTKAAYAWLHIEEIRYQKFSIGKKESNPLTQDLHHAVTSLSAELYTKDVHFLMELIQNAEDNEYEESVEPTLEFILTKEDIIGSGAPATLLIFNNEVGFSRKNMESLCSVGRSTKKGKRQQGFIGEKGIGFKSVFLVSTQPHVFSNGYQVRFREEPDSSCGIGYIVPEWVSEKPLLSDILGIYGSNKRLPTTIFVLPLKPDKVEAVKTQLSELHPEILLFLSKVKRLYVRENGRDSIDKDNVSIVSIASETNLEELSSRGADSRVVQLSVKEKACDDEETCKYFMWRQAFPVKPENRVSSRLDVEQWIITLAFPFGNRLKRGTSSVGVFAFLPTAMVTKFPFVIQGDFILASSREAILLDSLWNLGILACVPTAFVSAFQACVEQNSLFSSIAQVFEFLPAQPSSYLELNKVRESIRSQLGELRIVPYEMFDGNRYFAEPKRVVRVLPKFSLLLLQMKRKGVSLLGLCKLKKILHSSLDAQKYTPILEYLGVAYADQGLDWYAKCIESCNLVAQDSTEVYMELLCFLAENDKVSHSTYFQNIPLLKYTNRAGNVELCSISQIIKGGLTVKYAQNPEVHSWLSMCNMEFGCFNNVYFLPSDTQKSFARHVRNSEICYWLSSRARVTSFSACDYAYKLYHYVAGNKNLTVLVAHFLYQAHKKKFIEKSKIYDLCAKISIIDGCGHVRKERNVTLVPASRSKWVKLFGASNPYLNHSYVDIGDVYTKSGSFLGECTPDKVVLDFICKYSKAVDLPELSPPNLELNIASSRLSIEQAFMLLDWIRLLRTKGLNIPERFKESIQNGKWMKTYSGYKSPRQSILPNEIGKTMFDMMKHILKDISVIDQEFYSNKISMYQDELRFLGVGFGSDDVQRLVTTRLVSLASSGMKKEWAFSLLMFIGFLKQRNVIDEEWLRAIKKGEWLKTHQGYNAPEGSVLLLSKIEAASCSTITDLVVIDEAHYGSRLASFLSELKILGVITDLGELLKLIAEKASFPPNLPSVTADCGLLMLKCIKSSGPAAATSLIERIRGQPWLKTTSGFTSPLQTTFPNLRWSSLARVLQIPTIDELYYGDELRHYLSELSATGVAVDTTSMIEMIAAKFKFLSLSSKLGPDMVLSMLDRFKELRQTLSSGCSELQWLLTEKWLKTRHGYKAPNESIIFSAKWAAVSSFVELPLIDDGFYSIVIYKYKDELQMLGVITDFEDGAGLVLQGLKSPIDTEFVTADGVMALLKCLKAAMSKSLDQSMPENFLKNIAKSKCLKTANGYLVPEECVLFNSAWDKILKQTDVPSIDFEFYKLDISEYKEQLKAIGVKIDPMEVCSLISRLLFSQTETSLMTRLYNFLSQFNWKPEKLDESNSWVWIPNHVGDGGKWANSELCILQDKDDLFGSRLYSLSHFYKSELLPLFSSAFGVREFPSMGEYFQLWNDWVLSNDHQVSNVECHFFWECISKYWKPETEETFRQQFTKVPAITCLDDKIHLVNKENVFIPDDLRWKKIFASVSLPLFVWFPNSGGLSSALSRRLLEIYCSLGVKKISDSVNRKVGSILTEGKSENLIPKDGLIENGLLKIILAFLAGPRIEIPAKERQEATKTLLNLSLYESEQPIKILYCLSPYPNRTVEVETKKLVVWDKNSKQLIIDRSGYGDRKTNFEFGSCFAQVISEGLLPEGSELAVASLSRIIHLGLLYEFKEDSVDHLLLHENLKLFTEDIEFLDSAFMVTKQSGKRTVKSEHIAPPTPLPPCKKLCRSVP